MRISVGGEVRVFGIRHSREGGSPGYSRVHGDMSLTQADARKLDSRLRGMTL